MPDIDYNAVLRKTLARGGDFGDLYVEQTDVFSILCEENRIEKVLSGREWGAGVRLVASGRTAFAYTNELSTQALHDLADSVSRAAAVSPQPHWQAIDLSARLTAAYLPVLRPPRDETADKKTALVASANAAARSTDRRIRQVTVHYREQTQRVTIAGSDGFIARDERSYVTAFVQVVAAQDGIIQTAYEPLGGFCGMEIFDSLPLEAAARRAAQRAVMMLKARKAPAGRMAVVLSSEAGGTMIHEAVGHGLEADLAQAGLSVYSGKLGAQIASPLITVIDDATLAGRRGSFRFDDEGTPAQRTVLVENGVLKSFLYDRLTAMKEVAGSTGNGRRESYRHRPIPRMSNTFIAPGADDPAGILRSTPQGLYVKRMGGGQVNTVNGDFVFEVSEGYLIENGALGEPVRGATLTGNGPRVLMAIDRVGSDLGFSIGTCGKDGQGAPVSDAQPTLRIPEIIVGGEVGS